MKKADLASILENVRIKVIKLEDEKLFKVPIKIEDIAEEIKELINDINEGVFDE